MGTFLSVLLAIAIIIAIDRIVYWVGSWGNAAIRARRAIRAEAEAVAREKALLREERAKNEMVLAELGKVLLDLEERAVKRDGSWYPGLHQASAQLAESKREIVALKEEIAKAPVRSKEELREILSQLQSVQIAHQEKVFDMMRGLIAEHHAARCVPQGTVYVPIFGCSCGSDGPRCSLCGFRINVSGEAGGCLCPQGPCCFMCKLPIRGMNRSAVAIQCICATGSHCGTCFQQIREVGFRVADPEL